MIETEPRINLEKKYNTRKGIYVLTYNDKPPYKIGMTNGVIGKRMYICTLVIPTRPHTRTHLRSAEGSLVCPWFRSLDLVDANLVFGGRTAFS